jgi:putative glutamine amidotransferase
MKERHIILLLAILCLPLLIPLIPLMLLFRFGSPRKGVKIGVTVSDWWPDYFQYMRFPYDLALYRAGAKVVTISPRNIDKVGELLEQVDGVVLAGGEDIGDNQICDDLGFKVLQEAEKKDMPILGVCRGMQMMAISHGGKLTTHDEDPELFRRHKAGLLSIAGHDVNLNKDSLLFGIIGRETIHVNSIHHQSVKSPGDLSVSGTSKDGNIEAIESKNKNFKLGVQWHPEIRAIFSPKNEKIFRALVDNAVEMKGLDPSSLIELRRTR